MPSKEPKKLLKKQPAAPCADLKPPNPDPDGDNEEEPSEYERLRLANIARNASVMVELGLDGHPTSGRHRRGSSSNTSNSSTRPIKRPKPAALPPSVPERRSTRAAGLPAPNYKEVPAFRIRDLEGRSTSGRGKYGSTMDIKVEDGEEEVEEAESSERQLVRVPKLSVQLPPDAASSRAMYCNLEALLGPKQLGRAVSNGHTKAGVMASLKRPSDASHAKFSKYSGVVEWRNAVLLWVNVGGRDYANAFADGGQRMTWFAGPKHDYATPVIARILQPSIAVGSNGKAKGKDDDEAALRPQSENIVLMCRVQPGAYVCCGRVAVEFSGKRDTPTWQPANAQQPIHSRPLRFSLRLLDCDAMLASSSADASTDNIDGGDGDEARTFAEILRAASN